MITGRAASVHARLINLAKVRGVDPNRILERYALERWLYRLSISEQHERLCLKGALLFDLWFGATHRPTRDADFIGFGRAETAALEALVRGVCAIEVDDGLSFDLDALQIEEIREEARYDGLRVRLHACLGKGRIPMQLDVAYGDAVTPGMDEVQYPTLLDESSPARLKVYPRATVVAEKLEAMVSLGMTNTRMKDYYDVLALAREGAIDPALLGQAIAATFKRRETALPLGLPVGLAAEFAEDRAKEQQWQAFLRKNQLEGPSLGVVVNEISTFVEIPLQFARGTSA